MINLDQSATSSVKPDAVYERMLWAMKEYGLNINRGSYAGAYELEGRILDLRQKLSDFFEGYGAQNVVFTSNVTTALNMTIQGLLKKGDHILISAMEHNAVFRVVKKLESEGLITYDVIEADSFGQMNLESLESLIKGNTRAIITNFASNICPQVQPIEKIGEIARNHGLVYILDTAQGGGSHKISMKKAKVDILCFTGHKGLLGPQGVGGFLIKEELVSKVSPLIVGGSGSDSTNEFMPEFMPDKFEAGTLNIVGLVGLEAGLDYILDKGVETIGEKEKKLTEYFIKEVEKLGGYRIYANKKRDRLVANISLSANFMDDASLAFILDEEYAIQTRVGLHCAPLAHKTIESYPKGSIRFSFGAFTTREEIEVALKALEEIQFAKKC